MRRPGHGAGGRRVLVTAVSRRGPEKSGRRTDRVRDQRVVDVRRRRSDAVAGAPTKRRELEAAARDRRQQGQRRDSRQRLRRRLWTEQLVRGLVAELFARQHRPPAVQRGGRDRRRRVFAATAAQTARGRRRRRRRGIGRQQDWRKNCRRGSARGCGQIRGRGRSSATAATTTGGRCGTAADVIVQKDFERGQRPTAAPATTTTTTAKTTTIATVAAAATTTITATSAKTAHAAKTAATGTPAADRSTTVQP